VAIDEGFTCIDCHNGIAHQLPDMQSIVQAASELFDNALQTDDLTQVVLHTVAEKKVYASPDMTAPVVATLSTAAKIKVLERNLDGWMKIELAGEEVLGDTSKLFLDTTSGVVAATIFSGLEYTSDRAKVDPDTRLRWREARVSGWVTDDVLSSNLESIWDYAKVVYESECARCHAIFSPSAFKAPEWVNTINNMRRYSRLGTRDYNLISSYLQQHAQALGDI
jgi:trimethylamine-N-oxide reductase cytochrome c-type subunit TorC